MQGVPGKLKRIVKVLVVKKDPRIKATDADLAAQFDLARQIRSQYTIGYTSKNGRRDGAFRRIVVQTSRAGLTPRTKKGYFAPTAR